MPSMDTPETLTCTIDRIELAKAVLEFENRQQLVVSKKFLPKNLAEGAVLRVEFLTDELATERRQNLARAVLEEILNETVE